MAKKHDDDDAVAETTTDEASVPSMPYGYPYDKDLARIQQQQYLLVTYVDLAIKAEQIIGGEETATRVRSGLDRLQAIVDTLAEA